MKEEILPFVYHFNEQKVKIVFKDAQFEQLIEALLSIIIFVRTPMTDDWPLLSEDFNDPTPPQDT